MKCPDCSSSVMVRIDGNVYRCLGCEQLYRETKPSFKRFDKYVAVLGMMILFGFIISSRLQGDLVFWFFCGFVPYGLFNIFYLLLRYSRLTRTGDMVKIENK